MRRAIIAISCMLIGASLLTFISALLIPMLKELPARAKKGETEIHISSSSNKQSLTKSVQTTVASTAASEPKPSSTPYQSEVPQNQPKDITLSDQPQPTSAPPELVTGLPVRKSEVRLDCFQQSHAPWT